MLWIVAVIVAGSIQTLTAADGIWNRVDNTDVVSPAAWSHAGNWVDGQIAGAGGHAYFTNAFPTKAYRAVEIPPEGITLNRFWFKNHDGTAWDGAFLFVSGGPMRMEEVGGITPRLDSTSDQIHLYVPIHGTQGLDSNPSWSVNLFADNAYTGTTTLEGGYWITRFDGIAESSDPVLSDYAATNDYVLTGGRLTFYGRRSMGAAVTSQWALVEGSAVVTYVSGPNSGALTPGVAVAGDGIPAGTFVRRIIDTAHLQLSLPATATGAAVALSFSPLASSCYQMIQSIENLHGNGTIMVNKNGAGSLGNDRDYRSGGQRIAEVILFNRPLSPDEQSTLDAYLMKKWFGETLPRQIGNLSLADGTRLVLPDEETLIVKHLTATGDVWLEGPGQLLVTGGLTQAGTVHVVHGGGVAAAGLGGSLAAPQPLVAENPAFWVDACTLTNAPAPDVVEEGGSYYVTRWADVRGTGYPFATNVTLRPTLRLNDINGLPSVKFTRIANVVPAQSEALFWDQPLKEIRAVFVVIGSQEGGGILLGSSAAENTLDFYRGAWVDPARSIFNASGSGAAAELINGPVYLNGLPVDPLVAGYNGFFQLVEAFPTGPVQASAFAADRNVVSGNGCQRLCEVILYTRELSEAEQMDTAEYLMRKWFGRSTPRAGAVTTLDALAADGATTVDLASTNDYLAVTRCTGSGPFIKRGAGTLVLKSVGLSGQPLDVQDGTLILKAGDPADNIPADAFLHVDASQPDTLEFDPAEGAFAVERWLDCRNGPHFARVRTTAWRPHPVLEEQALNGLPVIDFGTLMTGRPTTPQQCFFEWDQPCSNVWDAFLVVGSAAGGNVMLGNKVSSLRHFRRSVSSDYTRPVLDGNASTLLRMGETRLNGQVVNPSSAAAGLSGTYDLISFSAFGGGVYADAFAIDAYVSTAGQQLGEVLVYDRPLTYQQRLDIEAYLLKKWFNTDSPCYEPSAVGTLAVADSAHVEIDGVLSLDGLSGAGTISGDLDLSLGAVLTVSVAAGSTSGLTVNGTVTAAGSETVVLTGDVPGLLPGIHTVFSCTSLSGAEGWPESWSVIGVPAKYAARLVSDGAVLYLRLSAKGSLLKVK